MIGGDDLVLEGTPRGSELDFAVRWLRREWRQAVVDVPGRGVLPISSERLFPLTDAAEAFIYRDRNSFESWRETGLTEQNSDALIWIAVNDDCLVFVIDDRSSPLGRLVCELIESLEQNRWQIREAAA
jgi:hypothetical protein